VNASLLGLEDWFAPFDLSTFVGTVLGRRPLHVPSRPQLATRLIESFGIGSIDDILALLDPEILAWMPRLDGVTMPAPVSPVMTLYPGCNSSVRSVTSARFLIRSVVSILLLGTNLVFEPVLGKRKLSLIA